MKKLTFAPQGLMHYRRVCNYDSENVMIELDGSIFTVFKDGSYICERGSHTICPILDPFAFGIAQSLLEGGRNFYNVVRFSYLALIVVQCLEGLSND